MWIELVAAVICAASFMPRWTSLRSSERLLVLWVLVGLAELVVHDSGNERRYVMFIPAVVALAATWLAPRGTTTIYAPVPSRRALAATGVILVPLLYVAIGTALRPLLIADIEAGRLALAVRLSGAAALGAAVVLAWKWRTALALSAQPLAPRLASALVAVVAVWNLVIFADWARHRTTLNHDASVALGRLLPDGALVQGKLANGLSLENRIRPLFVGNGFGNYDDRLRREDARYILTYDLPRIGYESSDGSGLIQGILDHYPGRRTIAVLDVDETQGPDRAVLIDKFPDLPAHARD
jgi:hypothetical protein